MDQTRTLLALSFIVGAGPVGLSQRLAQARASEVEPRAKITIWVYNYARVPGRALAQAEKEIDRKLTEIGVGTDWVECPLSAAEIEVHPSCQQRMAPTELALVILPRFIAPDGRGGDTYFGSAQVFTNGQLGHYTYVFYDRVADSANRGDASSDQMLANVAVHEIGHLLLGSNRHSAKGLMRAQWDRNDLQRLAWGQLRFDSEESERIRVEVRTRMAKLETRIVSALDASR